MKVVRTSGSRGLRKAPERQTPYSGGMRWYYLSQRTDQGEVKKILRNCRINSKSDKKRRRVGREVKQKRNFPNKFRRWGRQVSRSAEDCAEEQGESRPKRGREISMKRTLLLKGGQRKTSSNEKNKDRGRMGREREEGKVGGI